jgi:hypothetical protein
MITELPLRASFPLPLIGLSSTPAGTDIDVSLTLFTEPLHQYRGQYVLPDPLQRLQVLTLVRLKTLADALDLPGTAAQGNERLGTWLEPMPAQNTFNAAISRTFSVPLS